MAGTEMEGDREDRRRSRSGEHKDDRSGHGGGNRMCSQVISANMRVEARRRTTMTGAAEAGSLVVSSRDRNCEDAMEEREKFLSPPRPDHYNLHRSVH